MGRQSKAELLGLIEQIVELHDKQHLTHEQIAEKLQAEGHEISREAVRRTYSNASRKAEKYKLAAETAKNIIDASKGTNTELAEAANSIVATMFYDRILKMEDLDFETDEQFFKALGPVMKNQAILAKARLSYEKGVERAKTAVWDELADIIQDDPILLAKLEEAFAKVKE